MNHRSFRVRLMAVILAGMVTLDLANTVVDQWTLFEVRDRAVGDGAAALREQATASFERQVQQRAETTNQSLTAIKLIAATASEMLAADMPGARLGPALALARSPDGWRYQQGVTTVLVPPGDDPRALADVAASVRMDVGFPGLVRAFPEISRIAYLASSGVYRTFPQTELARLPEAHLPARNPGGQLIWWAPHQDIATAAQVISAVAPVYVDARLAGADGAGAQRRPQHDRRPA